MVYVFYTLVYYSPTESEEYSLPQVEECDPLYVPSAALNPLQMRRFTMIRIMAQTNAVLVHRQINTGAVSYCPITKHLFGPPSIAASICGHSQLYSKNVYLVHDVHAKVS